jgi:hypothetical protein
VHGIADAIVTSAAVKVYVCNLMTQANESLGLSAADHIRALNHHAQVERIFDYALINRTPVPIELKAKYALEGATQIVADLEAIEALGVCPVLGDYLEEGDVARQTKSRETCWNWLHKRLQLAIEPDLTTPSRHSRVDDLEPGLHIADSCPSWFVPSTR